MSMCSIFHDNDDLKMDDETAQQIRERRRKKLQWSFEERSFRNRQAFREKDCGECASTFSACADAVLRKSVFGVYLKSMNEKENQDRFLNENKLGITQWDLMRYSDDELQEFLEKNLLTDDMYDLLLKAVKTLEVIDWDYLHESLISLRLSNCNMQWLDEGLNKFKHLVVLILTGNFLQRLPGNLLPRKLQFLEVYANEITNLASFVQKSPKRILHIGLGRNQLADVSDCHLLCNSQNFYRLRTLDLSDNDFVDLQGTVTALSTLKYLQSLNLEGNPCSVCVSYKDAVLENLPQLIYLDNVELLEKDRKIADASLVNIAILVFNCYRITGLPAPPKQKNVKQTIHIEVSFPLLEPLDIAELNSEPLEDTKVKAPAAPPPSPTQSKTSRSGSQQSKKSKTSIKSLGRKSSAKNKSSSEKDNIQRKEPGLYDDPDEYENEVRLQLKNPSFKTERTTWSKIMQFSEDCVIVETDECDLVKIRDTFRSCVEVRVVYLMTTMPVKPKKPKGKKSKKNKERADRKEGKGDKEKKPKKGNNKAKETGNRKRKESKKSEKEISEEDIGDELQQQEVPKLPPVSPPPPENILKKITLVKFKCDLHSINWSDKTIDFYWAKHEEVGEEAIPVEGSLKAINYTEGKRKAKEKKEPKKEKKDEQNIVIEDVENLAPREIGKQKVPSYMTVQVGFGLKRSYFLKNEELPIQE